MRPHMNTMPIEPRNQNNQMIAMKKSAPTKPSTPKLDPAEGIYYVVRRPDGWRLCSNRYASGPEIGHPAFWEERLAARVAAGWAAALGVPGIRLEAELRLCCYGFPRGRVARRGRRFVVFHGNDVMRFMRVARHDIEKAFGIEGVALWEHDEHEQCLDTDKLTVRQCLGLLEDWPCHLSEPGRELEE